MEWISIEEKMPEKLGNYLVTNGNCILICGLLRDMKTFYGIGGATHWMSLPELPKIKNK